MAIYILVWTITTSDFVGKKTIDIDVRAFKTAASCMEAKQEQKDGKGDCMRVELE